MSTEAPNRLAILDAIRFVCASWVLFFHAGFLPFTAGVDKSTRAGLAVYAFSSNLFYGSAGVIAFFVISGFCVHYPYRTCPETNWLSYFARRYLRIGIPMLAAYLIARSLGVGAIEEGIMWTLRCELVYYTLYPALVWARNRSGWNTVLASQSGFGSRLRLPASSSTSRSLTTFTAVSRVYRAGSWARSWQIATSASPMQSLPLKFGAGA